MFSKFSSVAGAACLALAALVPAAVQAAPAKVLICHITGNANDSVVTPPVGTFIPSNLWLFGRLIEVNENAVDAHLGHDDSATPHPRPANPQVSGWYWTTAELVNLPLFGGYFRNLFEQGHYPNADCGVRYPILP